MTTSASPTVDPSKIFIQADCFYRALEMLCNVDPDNTQLAVTIGEPVMVIGALTIELFLKCLICVETGRVPRGHKLLELFDQLTPSTRARIQRRWDHSIAVHRAKEWDDLEQGLGVKISRELRDALAVGSDAFEKVRYSYEGKNEGLQYYLQDFPQLLRNVILQMMPEWRHIQRDYRPLPPSSGH